MDKSHSMCRRWWRALLVVVLTSTIVAWSIPASAAPPPLLGGTAAPVLGGEMPMRTYSLDFYRRPGGMESAVIRAMAMQVEGAITSDLASIGGAGLSGRVSISFEPPQTGACAIRGLTLSDQHTIHLYYAPATDPRRVVSILSHELFHQLQHDYYGERVHRRADVILLEGMAVWGSRAYFSDASGQPSYRSNVRQWSRDNTLMPLTTSLEADCRTTTRVSIYDEWASFVEYLLTTYGRAKFDALYRDSTGRTAGSANYTDVYDKTLPQLEAAWREWLAT